ncbi:bifunctional nuclease 2 isoform X3 [Prunus avium]|uniref:Bifunctional nuclease 2 isoform X3 n=1 Tax=Prunus avium TaxID=42229 RepID=A0A6P5T0E2_PRUAV|nr:bifunctional nuclease 2 isoform X3 [Prunus avium]
MIGAQFHLTDRSAAIRSIPSTWPAASSASSSSLHLVFTVRLGLRTTKRCRGLKSIGITCNNFSSRSRSSNAHHHDYDYLQASLLLSETISHYRMQKRGFKEETKWQSSGEFAIENLIDAQWGDENGDSPDQFQFVSNLVDKLGYQVNMVRITERVMNTYFAGLCFSKPGENEVFNVDARPSDAINVAHRSKVPIYVNKRIVLTDAVRISYGMGRVRDTKSAYDVSLDSAADGPDFLIQELKLVNNISLAIKEERYKDAAMWRDKLVKLRKSIQGP